MEKQVRVFPEVQPVRVRSQDGEAGGGYADFAFEFFPEVEGGEFQTVSLGDIHYLSGEAENFHANHEVFGQKIAVGSEPGVEVSADGIKLTDCADTTKNPAHMPLDEAFIAPVETLPLTS